MLKNKKFFLLAISAFLVCSLGAQTNSPYSRYGYGVLKDQAVGPSKSMGGIGYGLRHKMGANPINPASYSNVDSLTFLFDVGVNYTNAKLTDENATQNDDNGGLDYVTILFPIAKGLGISAGIIPYSSVGYSFGKTEQQGNVISAKSFNGSGGFSQIYAGIGYETPFKGLSLGANASYLFGKLEHTRNIGFSESSALSSIEITNLKIRTVKFDLGVQYQMPLSPKNVLTIGALYSPQMSTTAKFKSLHQDYTASGSIINSGGDTLKTDVGLPATYGLGFTIVHNNKLTFGADVTYQSWKNTKYPDEMGDGMSVGDRFNDRWKYSAGIEYAIDPTDRNFFKRMRFRGGLNYSNSYLNVNLRDQNDQVINIPHKYNEYGATLGFGLPIREPEMYGGRTTFVNINLEYKRIDPEVKSMIKEEYIGISVNVNINELWFVKKKIF